MADPLQLYAEIKQEIDALELKIGAAAAAVATAGNNGFAEKRYDDLVKEKTVLLASRDKLLAVVATGAAGSAGGSKREAEEAGILSPTLTRAVIQIVEGVVGRERRSGTSYARLFDAHTLGVLELSQPGADVPAFPLNYIKRVNVGTSENEVLLPQVLDLLRSLPGAKDKCLQGRKAVLYNGIVFVDTHKQYYLNQKAPDISVIADGCAVSAFAALAVLELQVGPIDKSHQGKMESYLEDLLDANLDRPWARGAVFNGSDVVFFQATRSRERDRHVEYQMYMPLSMDTGPSSGATHTWGLFWTFFCGDSILNRFGWEPPKLYAPDLQTSSTRASSGGPLQLARFIASSGCVRVWELGPPFAKAVCKHFTGVQRARSLQTELNALLHIASAGGHDCWPELVGYNSMEGQRLLITQPLVEPLLSLSSKGLKALFIGFKFLHEVVKFIHRDVEAKHIGVSQDGRISVIDLSTCVPLPEGLPDGPVDPSYGYYSGTVVNASDDVLTAFLEPAGAIDGRVEVPSRKQQDLVALVKTVYVLARPHRLSTIQDVAISAAKDLATNTIESVSRAVASVRSLWNSEFNPDNAAGRKWRELVQMAHVDEPRAPLSYSDAMKKLQDELEVLL